MATLKSELIALMGGIVPANKQEDLADGIIDSLSNRDAIQQIRKEIKEKAKDERLQSVLSKLPEGTELPPHVINLIRNGR